tara:strand:+ start:1362 stop:1640 length:279 start_codon:yes stop_codon:yes gene_type:complete
MRTYVATIHLKEGGGFFAFIANNKSLYNFELNDTTESLPLFFTERIALLKLCSDSNIGEGESIGRRLSDAMFHVYLDREEFMILKNTYRSAL